MSKFFRTSSSSASSSSDDSDGDDDIAPHEKQDVSRSRELTDEVSTALTSLDVTTRGSENGWHSQVLLHALLEERCMNDVLRENRVSRPGRRPNDPALRAEAQARYQRLCSVLSPHNLVTPGLEHESLSATRQRYRDGLDMLSHSALAIHAPTLPAPLGHVISNLDEDQISASQPLQLARTSTAGSSILDTMSPAHAMLEPSRYLREFDQLGVLGKGGFGTVFLVKHRLDDMQYAVKVVPISAARIARIRLRGQPELDDLLLELRTIARLDHPHVVRYFSSWIQWTNVTSASQASDSFSGLTQSYAQWSGDFDAVAGAEFSEPPLGRIVTQSDSDANGIVFETSAAQDNTRSIYSSDNHRATSVLSENEVSSVDNGFAGLARASSGLALAIHLQMAVYPLTLADFLMPPAAAVDEGTPLVHCFQLQASLDILLALVDGVEYLHSQGILHRDLKPANVFLSKSGTRLDVRIGDFGLVTALAHPETSVGAQNGPVGTEMYRPIAGTTSRSSASLDIFALGIIAFELLWQFGTRMERHDTLQRLRHGEFPVHFCERIGDTSGVVQSLVRDMISQESYSVVDIKQRVVALIT